MKKVLNFIFILLVSFLAFDGLEHRDRGCGVTPSNCKP